MPLGWQTFKYSQYDWNIIILLYYLSMISGRYQDITFIFINSKINLCNVLITKLILSIIYGNSRENDLVLAPYTIVLILCIYELKYTNYCLLN
jgi:hypothetical protein